MDQIPAQTLSADEGTALWFLNSLVTIKATSASTGGAFSLFHQILPPGFATPYHFHQIQDEAFYVLEGRVTLFSDGVRSELTSGGYAFLPHPLPHGFRNGGPEPAALLYLALPGDHLLGFIGEMSQPATQRTLPPPTRPDFEKLHRLSAKYHVDTLGPLPA